MTGPTHQTLEALELLQWPGIGAAKMRRVFRSRGDGDSLLELAGDLFPVPAEARTQATAKAGEIAHQCEDLGIHILGLGDPGYPALLKTIDDPPPVLYVRGHLEALSGTAVAVVGTRRASEAGLLIARTIAQALVKRDITVVSGLALGIDAAAHRGALDSHGRTVAIMAHGLHTILPRTNKDIGQALLEQGGALVSEHPPGVLPRRAEFVRRNRMQSGMSICSIIVESDVQGGAMHQANFTRKQGRPLLTVLRASPDAGGLNEAGARHLISSLGATAIKTTGELGHQLARIRQAAPRAALQAQASLL